MNKENLLKLADWVEKNVTQDQFSMRHYRQKNGKLCIFYGKNNCGTVGCLLGWAPFVPGLEDKEIDYNYHLELSFNKYCDRVFEVEVNGDDLWDSLFSDRWTNIDNTVQGAVRRIRYVVERGDDAVYELLERLRNEN